MMLDYPGGPDVITRVPIRRRQELTVRIRGQGNVLMDQRLEQGALAKDYRLSLEAENNNNNNNKQQQQHNFPLGASRRNQLCQHLDWPVRILISTLIR